MPALCHQTEIPHSTAQAIALTTPSFVGFNYGAAAVVVPQPSIADEIAHHREIAVRIARGHAGAISLGFVFVDAVVGVRKHRQGDRLTLRDQFAQASCRFRAGGFGVVLAEYP